MTARRLYARVGLIQSARAVVSIMRSGFLPDRWRHWPGSRSPNREPDLFILGPMAAFLERAGRLILGGHDVEIPPPPGPLIDVLLGPDERVAVVVVPTRGRTGEGARPVFGA